MSAPRPQPKANYLHECFHYDPFTGDLTWKTRPESHFNDAKGYILHASRCAGKNAGTVAHDGAIKIRLNGRNYQATRIIWKMQTGREPDGFVMALNGVNGDNRWQNLKIMNNTRWGTMANDCQDTPVPAGIHTPIHFNRRTDKWTVFIKGFYHNLGYFNHHSAAVVAYERAMR